jgi:periplasmic divalent cation tolerance protein
MTDKRVVFTACGSAEEANRIARELVERRLAACVNIVPGVESVYRWKGEIESAAEWLLIIKTTAAAFEKLREAISELHSYDVPECVALTVEDGGADYLEWIATAVK